MARQEEEAVCAQGASSHLSHANCLHSSRANQVNLMPTVCMFIHMPARGPTFRLGKVAPQWLLQSTLISLHTCV